MNISCVILICYYCGPKMKQACIPLRSPKSEGGCPEKNEEEPVSIKVAAFSEDLG